MHGCLSIGPARHEEFSRQGPDAISLRGGGWIDVRAILHNRHDLVRRLALADTPSPRSDAELVAEAYQHWGPECGAHLVGKWAYAACDTTNRRRVLSRDAFGLAPLYYHQKNDRIWFSDSLTDLQARAGLPRHLDPVPLAQLGLGTKRDTRCFQRGAHSVPPAQALVFTSDGTKHRVRYWQPANVPEIRYASDGAYREAFLALYDEVVAAMLDGAGPVGIALSSGLDSASAAAIAAPQLALRGEPLRAFCWVPAPGAHALPMKGRNSNEWEGAEQVASHVGNIGLTRVSGYPDGVLAAVRRMLAVTDDLSNAIPGWGWYDSILRQAAADGVGTILTGDFGNHTISQERREVAVSPLRRIVRDARIKWRRQRREAIAHPRLLVRPDFVRRTLAGVPPADPELNALWRHARQPLRSLYNILHSGGAAETGQFAAALGMRLGMPALDRRLVEFCLGIPDDQIARGHETRRLIRHGFAGRLPDAILQSRERGLPGSDYALAVAAEGEAVRAILDSAGRSPIVRDALNLRWLERTAARMVADPEQLDAPAAGLLMRGVTYAMFLDSFDDVAPA